MAPKSIVSAVLIALVALLCKTEAAESGQPSIVPSVSAQNPPPAAASAQEPVKPIVSPVQHDGESGQGFGSLEGRGSERSFIRDIVERLHALDADIGKLLYNSTSMYAPDDQTAVFRENQPKGGERFAEVLADLDSLQDEVSLNRLDTAYL